MINKLSEYLKKSKIKKEIPLESDGIVVSEKSPKVSRLIKKIKDIEIPIESKTTYNRKVASSNTSNKIEDVLKSIYEENPSYFPNGLTIDLYTGPKDRLTLLKYKGDPAGFIGYQHRNRDNKEIGYVSIGLLPEYRGKGLAKKAMREHIEDLLSAKDKLGFNKLLWTASKDNNGSINLFKSYFKEKYPIELKLL